MLGFNRLDISGISMKPSSRDKNLRCPFPFPGLGLYHLHSVVNLHPCGCCVFLGNFKYLFVAPTLHFRVPQGRKCVGIMYLVYEPSQLH